MLKGIARQRMRVAGRMLGSLLLVIVSTTAAVVLLLRAARRRGAFLEPAA